MQNMHMHKHMLNKVESVQIWVDFFKIWFQHGFYEWFYFNTYYWTQHQKWQKFLKFLGHDKKFLWSSKVLFIYKTRFWNHALKARFLFSRSVLLRVVSRCAVCRKHASYKGPIYLQFPLIIPTLFPT